MGSDFRYVNEFKFPKEMGFTASCRGSRGRKKYAQGGMVTSGMMDDGMMDDGMMGDGMMPKRRMRKGGRVSPTKGARTWTHLGRTRRRSKSKSKSCK